MALIHTVTAFASFGVGVRCLSLAMCKRPWFDKLEIHALHAIGFGGIGYWYYNYEQRQTLALEVRKDKLLERKKRMLAQESA
ncbi:hypothetical protein K7432_014444 [Basidiobolus ranarum]|uniref:Uncharacterized protein n=1 Tax=Basidiobolus ranarum TaxID=34480 RepID=A0ABR2VPM8_9FUNG